MRDGLPPTPSQNGPEAPKVKRARWLGVLAKASPFVLKAAWEGLENKPVYRLLRGPETGLALVRGRIGGIGERFNIGEISLCRCSLALADGQGSEVAGHGYVAGCDQDQVRYVALFDALLQLPAYSKLLESELIEPLAAEQEKRRRQQIETAQASRVEFFTMVRGD